MKAEFSESNPLEPGVWDARVRGIIDLGIQESPLYGKKHQIWISFETEQIDDYGKGKTIGSFFSLSLNDKSNLSKLILGIFGKYVPADKKADFDFRCLLDQPVQITVVEEPRKDGSGTKLKISSYGYIKNNRDTVAPLSRDTEFFDLDDPDWDLYESLGDWLKGQINLEKDEEKSDKDEKPAKNKSEKQEEIEDFSDDIPF